MNSLVDSDLQRFCACLVLGYLENQQLQKAYSSFCETSRHLTKEKKGLKYGNKPLDTSAGFVSIIREYFQIKSRINEFLRLCPLSPVVIRLIDTDDTLQRLEIILETLKDNLGKIDEIQAEENSKKRKHNDCNFNISQSNTSTPETAHPAKRLRKSLTTPFLTLSADKENKFKHIDKSLMGRTELDNNSSSSETSNKEDDDDVDEEIVDSSKSSTSPHVLTANPEQLSETFLNKLDFVDKVVDIINQTRSAKETEPTTSKETPESGLTTDDLQDILSKTQNDPSFDEIVNDIVNKYLLDFPDPNSAAQSSTSSEKPSEQSNELEEIPIKQRLRPRSEKKTPIAERKRKINIISNEPYTGVVPAAANLLPNPMTSQQEIKNDQQQHIVFSLPILVQNGLEMVSVLQSVPSSSTDPLENSAPLAEIAKSHQNFVESKTLQLERSTTAVVHKKLEDDHISKTEVETKELTPKMKMHPNFLESKCKSTPRRKATHVRILDFNHTPSNRKLAMIKEFSTPISSGIPSTTPGSAPATIASCKSAMKPQELESEAAIDENSNSNSISHTPKVVKNRRRRKIAVSKSTEKKQKQEQSEEQRKSDISLEDWFTIRKQSKELPIDQQVRNANEKAEAEGKIQRQKRRTPKRRSVKKKMSSRSNKSLTKSPDEQKENKEKNCSEENSTSVEYDENKPLIKFKIKSPRKTAALKNTPKKKKKKSVVENQEQKRQNGEKTTVQEDDGPTSLNRSDTVQEVATMLTTLSETILAKDCSVKNTQVIVEKHQTDSDIDQNHLLETPFKGFSETPFKDNSLTPLPNTPRFAIPLASQSANETPAPKIFSSSCNIMSLVKTYDILTPTFPITPGIKETPLKDVIEGSPNTASGYSSRRTDYSSCSSYYKPDESEDINIAFLGARQRSDRTSQSESDAEKPLKIIGSTKKVECPGAIERVKSFTEDQKALPTPHYTMMDEGLLSESMVTTATDDSSCSSSSFTCSTCSTDPSDDENTIEKLNKDTADVDSEWHCDDAETEKEAAKSSAAVMDERTGEVRFPLRNWITPKKVEVGEEQVQLAETNKTKTLLNEIEPQRKISQQEEHERRFQQMKEVRQRTLEKIRMDSAAIRQRSQPTPQQKFKRNNLKTFKLPSEEAPKAIAITRKDQILQQNLTERPRPTPLKLIPSSSSSSSSRRKNATPRKTIVIDELPRQPSPIKKKKEKKEETALKSPGKLLSRLSIENASDNAVMPDTSFDDESVLADKSITAEVELSQILQDSSKHENNDTKEIRNEAVDEEINDFSESDGESEDDDEELEIVSAEEMRRNEFFFEESENFQRLRSEISKTAPKIPPTIINIDGRKITLKSSGLIEVFNIDPISGVTENNSKTKSATKQSSDDERLSNSKEAKSAKNEKIAKPSKKSDLQGAVKSKPTVKINIKEKEKSSSKNPTSDIRYTDINAVLDKLHGSVSNVS